MIAYSIIRDSIVSNVPQHPMRTYIRGRIGVSKLKEWCYRWVKTLFSQVLTLIAFISYVLGLRLCVIVYTQVTALALLFPANSSFQPTLVSARLYWFLCTTYSAAAQGTEV